MRATKIVWLVGCLLVFGLAGKGRADFVTATLNGTGLDDTISPGAYVTINLGDGSTPSINYKPGLVNWTGSPTNAPALRGAFTTFCLELTQDISPGSTYVYNLVALESAPKPGSAATGGAGGMGAAKGTEIRQLWTAFHGSIGSDGAKAAAFQLAIWKIESDWGTGAAATDFTKGNFQASGNTSATTLASTWLTNLTLNTYAPDQSLMALSSGSYQDQLVSVPVPLPPGFVLGSSGLVVLLGYVYLMSRVPRHQCARARIAPGRKNS
jgi:hypothetical protein